MIFVTETGPLSSAGSTVMLPDAPGFAGSHGFHLRDVLHPAATTQQQLQRFARRDVHFCRMLRTATIACFNHSVSASAAHQPEMHRTAGTAAA